MSAAFEAALGQLGLIERNHLATMAIAKVIIDWPKRANATPGGCGVITSDDSDIITVIGIELNGSLSCFVVIA
jgi:hypothetical protein